MNVYWIAGLATIIVVEKMAPMGTVVSSLIGAALIVWGLDLLVHLG